MIANSLKQVGMPVNESMEVKNENGKLIARRLATCLIPSSPKTGEG